MLICPPLLLAGAALIIEVPDETNITGAPADCKKTDLPAAVGCLTCANKLQGAGNLRTCSVQLTSEVDGLLICFAPQDRAWLALDCQSPVLMCLIASLLC